MMSLWPERVGKRKEKTGKRPVKRKEKKKEKKRKEKMKKKIVKWWEKFIARRNLHGAANLLIGCESVELTCLVTATW